MKAPRTRGVPGTILLHSVDRRGRTIDPAVLAAAYTVARKAIRIGERQLGDSAMALDLLEEAAGAVSEALRNKKKGNDGPVRDLPAYLFRTYLRKLGPVRRKRKRLADSLRNAPKARFSEEEATRVEASLLFDKVMALYDSFTRQIVLRYLEGYSWEDIGREFGLKPHAAEVRYSRALAKARKALAKRLSKG